MATEQEDLNKEDTGNNAVTPEPESVGTAEGDGHSHAFVNVTMPEIGKLGPMEEVKEEETTQAPVVKDLGIQDSVKPVIDAVTPTAPTAPIVEKKEAPVASSFDAMIAKLKETGTPDQKSLIKAIETYMVNMAPGQLMDNNKGAQYQYSFWKLISSLVESAPQEEFKKLWSILLAYFDEYQKGAFAEKYVFRFSEYWHQNVDELSAYQRILNLIKLTANQANRSKGLKQIDMARTLELGFSEQARQRVLTFYNT